MTGMLGLIIKLNGDAAWPDLRGKPFIQLGDGSKPIEVTTLEEGMKSGRPSVAIRLTLPDGRAVIAETSARLFCSAARAIMARYPDLFKGD
jgi:hypothetical protein